MASGWLGSGYFISVQRLAPFLFASFFLGEGRGWFGSFFQFHFSFWFQYYHFTEEMERRRRLLLPFSVASVLILLLLDSSSAQMPGGCLHISLCIKCLLVHIHVRVQCSQVFQLLKKKKNSFMLLSWSPFLFFLLCGKFASFCFGRDDWFCLCLMMLAPWPGLILLVHFV